MADPKVRADRALAPALVEAFDDAKDDDPRVRRYLALAIGRLDPPLPPEAVDVLTGRSMTRQRVEPDSSRASTAGPNRTTRRGSARSGRWARRAIRPSSPTARAAVRRRPMPASARWSSTRSARCPATRRSPTLRDGAARRPRPTCAGTRRSRWRGTAAPRRAGAAADARPRVRRADGQARRAADIEDRIRWPTS